MTNFVQNGRVVTLTAPYTRTANQGALVGSIFGVAENDVTSGSEGEFAIEGVFDLTKAAGVDFAQGDKCYWDDSAKEVADTDSANSYLIGVAVKAAAVGDSTVRVRLNGTSVS